MEKIKMISNDLDEQTKEYLDLMQSTEQAVHSVMGIPKPKCGHTPPRTRSLYGRSLPKWFLNSPFLK